MTEALTRLIQQWEHVRTQGAGVNPTVDEFVLELLRREVVRVHNDLALQNEFLTPDGIHVFTGSLMTNWGFDDCPHPDCKFVREQIQALKADTGPDPTR